MSDSSIVTIERFILEQERMHPEATGDFTNLLYDIALAAKVISGYVRRAGLVERRKEGLMAWYSIQDPSIFEICDLVCGRLSEQYQADLAAIGQLHPDND